MNTDFVYPNTLLALLNKYGTGFREMKDPLFNEGNFYIKKFVRLGVLSDINRFNGDDDNQIEPTIICNVPNCHYSCTTVQQYESHYNSHHRYSCGECNKTLPSGHLLDLHLSEVHDSYFEAQVQSGKQPMYICFLEECSHRSKTSAERRDHCIKEHKFPHNFRFDKQTPAQKKSSGISTGMEVESVQQTITP
ncbi:protein lethal(2)k10201 isoform X2 [Malaya genurostris]|uniref:protein lethal(2)k10201 isoform X2 n=1 Tax=Malaya genurostris TaxID=325434 RepID=UPI0026F3B330|nr:protein lethal(2)k10201 isoform X2 [Malaya genurostris]